MNMNKHNSVHVSNATENNVSRAPYLKTSVDIASSRAMVQHTAELLAEPTTAMRLPVIRIQLIIVQKKKLTKSQFHPPSSQWNLRHAA